MSGRPLALPTDKLPVMVWIHGGSNNVGAGSQPDYDGGNLAKKNVVVVTINYRLDVFGFLAHPELTRELGRTHPATTDCWIKLQPYNGCRRTLPRLGAIPIW